SFCPFRPVYWLGNDTLRVFSGLKAKDSVMPKSVVVLQGGEKESFFHRAFGVTEAHCLGAIDVDSFLFVPKLPEMTSEIYTRFCTQACKICSLFDMGGEVHLEELVKIGILHGSVKDMMKVHLGSVIMPHGLGHLLGIDVEDVGGYPEPGSRNLLMGHLVQEWMVLMVEAGTYLISHLLDQAGPANPSLNCFISNQVLAHFCSFVGVCVQLFLKPFMSYSYLCNSLSGMLSK
uniref:Peptidase M24 domain-containing protein n=1 Tax=Astatotilapia calliptera TaxID=8154 RepID=A0AAX7TLH1_ASTCA